MDSRSRRSRSSVGSTQMSLDLHSLGGSTNNTGVSNTNVSNTTSIPSRWREDNSGSEAYLLSQATSTAVVAARSILLSGGSQQTALKTAKAAAFSVLSQSPSESDSTHAMGNSFLRRRKAKRQAEVVASMALTSAASDMQSPRAGGADWDGTMAGSDYKPPPSPNDTSVSADSRPFSYISGAPLEAASTMTASKAPSTRTSSYSKPPVHPDASVMSPTDMRSYATDQRSVDRMSIRSVELNSMSPRESNMSVKSNRSMGQQSATSARSRSSRASRQKLDARKIVLDAAKKRYGTCLTEDPIYSIPSVEDIDGEDEHHRSNDFNRNFDDRSNRNFDDRSNRNLGDRASRHFDVGSSTSTDSADSQSTDGLGYSYEPQRTEERSPSYFLSKHVDQDILTSLASAFTCGATDKYLNMSGNQSPKMPPARKIPQHFQQTPQDIHETSTYEYGSSESSGSSVSSAQILSQLNLSSSWDNAERGSVRDMFDDLSEEREKKEQKKPRSKRSVVDEREPQNEKRTPGVTEARSMAESLRSAVQTTVRSVRSAGDHLLRPLEQESVAGSVPQSVKSMTEGSAAPESVRSGAQSIANSFRPTPPSKTPEATMAESVAESLVSSGPQGSLAGSIRSPPSSGSVLSDGPQGSVAPMRTASPRHADKNSKGVTKTGVPPPPPLKSPRVKKMFGSLRKRRGGTPKAAD